jgi:hypothetical protein
MIDIEVQSILWIKAVQRRDWTWPSQTSGLYLEVILLKVCLIEADLYVKVVFDEDLIVHIFFWNNIS